MAEMISAKAEGPPQCEAAPPLTAHISMSAIKARSARGSASTTSCPCAFFTLTEYVGGRVGVGASFGLSCRGVSGGAATGLTIDLSSDIIVPLEQRRTTR